jgi:hypothetical protein
METDARLQSLFYLTSRVPSKGASPPSALAGVERPLVGTCFIELIFCRISTEDEVPVLGEAS